MFVNDKIGFLFAVILVICLIMPEIAHWSISKSRLAKQFRHN